MLGLDFETHEVELPEPSEPPIEATADAVGREGLPDDAEPVEGVDGYHCTRGDQQITVYGPDNTPVATGNNVRWGSMVGEVDGVRIPGSAYPGTGDFATLAARQHRAANLPAEQRDRVSVEIVPDSEARAGHVVVVHGTVKGDARDERAAKDVAHFLWSGKRSARVSNRTWKPETVDENFARLLTEFAQQGRDVLVSQAETQQEVIQAPAVPVPAAAQVASPPAAPDPQALTDQELLDAIRTTSGQVGYRIRRNETAVARAEALAAERQERVLRHITEAPDLASMSDAELSGEQEWLEGDLVGGRFTFEGAAGRTVATHRQALEGEALGRRARALLAQPSPTGLSAEALDKRYEHINQLWLKVRRGHPEHDAIWEHLRVVRDEMAVRRIHHYEQRADVAGLTLDELVAECADLSRSTEVVAVSGETNVAEARQARLEAVDAEVERREAVKFSNELSRARVRGKGTRREVSIDGMPRLYGHVTALHGPTFEARVGYTNGIGEFPSRPAAVAALVRHYDQDPRTLPQRLWGVPREVVLPVAARNELEEWLRARAVSPERERLAEILWDTPIRQPHVNPFTGKTMQAYTYSIEEGLFGELTRVGERVTTELRERAADQDLAKTVRDAAKRRIPIMGAALHDIARVREAITAAGVDPDRRAVDESKVAAQLAALADDGKGDSRDSESVQPDREAALGAVPTQGAGQDPGPGDVLREEGAGIGSGGDRSAGGAGGGAAARDGLPGADRSAEPDQGDGRAAGDGGAVAAAGVTRFRPDPADTPRTPLARATANVEAISVLRVLEREPRDATDDEKRILARWSGWGSVPVVFLECPNKDHPVYLQGGEREGRHGRDLARWEEYSTARDALRELLDPFEWNAAARAALSAYYTPQTLAEAMWDGLHAFGFDRGEVLEAGSGSGAFFGAAPANDAVRLTGIELDPTTARISQRIYPHANVLIESFADTDAPVGTFDAAIGNVPFAHQVRFGARRFGAGSHSLHNGFLIKELALVREGGLVMAVTSRWTLDSEDDAARRAMARYGDLVAAYRMPAGVFHETTGADVVVDVLVFRRRIEGQTPANSVWLDAPKRELNGSTHSVNAYFTAHPQHVLGELTTAPGPYGPAVTVRGDPMDAVQDLRAALQRTAERARAEGRSFQQYPQGYEREPLNLQTARDKHASDYSGRLYVTEGGRIWQHVNGADPVEAVPADGNTERLLALMRMRDVAVELRDLDRAGDDLARADEMRGRLRQLHTAYTERYGPLSRPRQTRRAAAGPTAWGWFRQDPDAATVLALDSWDRQRETAVPSEVLTHPARARRGELQRTDDPKVALAAVVGATGRVDLGRIAELLGTNPQEARRRLGREVFDNPVTGTLDHAGAYLSGAVRRKLDEARAAAATDPAYAVNVAALEAAQPREKRIGQFTPQLGAHWIPPELVQGFLRHYLGDPTLQVHHNDRYGWSVYAGKVPDAINALKGTERRSALHIARAALGYGSLIVENTVPQVGKVVRVVDEDASRAARQKAEAMRSAFEEYLTADSGRAKLVTDAYNRLMNGHVVRNYDGLSPTLAGFTEERTPHAHQLAGAARMQFERGVILGHEVGLGKTTTLIMGTQALKASGQIDKPFAVVQRHLAKQWLDEARFIYPHADIRLVTADHLSGAERRNTLEWLRSNRPDLTIFTEGAFTSVKMSPEYQEWYEFQEIESVREQILRERGVPDNALAVMKLEQRLANLEVRLRRNAAPMRTPGELYWDDLGFDYAAVDELHRFKGVGFRSKEGGGDSARIRGVDLHQKLTAMHRDADARGGRPTVAGATGTPLTNSITEQYTMLALVAPRVLEEFGVAGPDLWADTFGQKVQRIEMAPDGSGLKVVERFSRFVSKSTMKTMWGLVADTKSAEEVGVKRPELARGGPRLHLVDPTRDQQERLKQLVARGAAIHAGEVSREEDNMLAVANEGRAIACDPRLLDADAPPGPKLAAVADWFASRYHANKDRTYAVSISDPTPHPVPGGLIIGFLNQGTPGGSNKGGFNAYAAMRDLCVARGVPAEKIAFVQEHNSDPERLSEFYRRCREGEVSIVLASTETMGTGANIQNRAVGLAHIDLDWTPAAIEQRNGRIVRWGNQNSEVEIATFALKGSMDSWQAGLLASKAEGLRDIQRPAIGDDGDTVEEIGAVEWDFATMQAEIGGNPYMPALMKARRHLGGLEADRRNQAADRLRQTELLERKSAEAAGTREAIARRDEVIPLIKPVRGDDMAIQIGERRFTDREGAGRALRRAVNTTIVEQRVPGVGSWHVLGHFGGLPFGVRPAMTKSGELRASVGFPNLRHSDALYGFDDLTSEKVGGLMLSRMATALEKAPDQQVLDRQRLPGLDEEIALLTQQRTATDFTQRIEHARRRVELLDDVVAAIAERDKLPEPMAETVDTRRYKTEDERQQAIAARAEARLPLEGRVARAVEKLEAFDRRLEAPAIDAAAPFTPAEQARIRVAVEDYAAQYTGGPLGLGHEDAARYVSEGHLRGLVDEHGLRSVWDAVAAHIDAHPDLLERDEVASAARRTARRDQAAAASRDALAACHAGDLDGARTLIDAGELIDPDYRDRGTSWSRAREMVEELRARGCEELALASHPSEVSAGRDGPGLDPL